MLEDDKLELLLPLREPAGLTTRTATPGVHLADRAGHGRSQARRQAPMAAAHIRQRLDSPAAPRARTVEASEPWLHAGANLAGPAIVNTT